MSIVVPPFEGPRMKVAHARHHIATIAQILAEHAKVVEVISYSRQHATLDTHMEYCFDYQPPVPPEIALVLGDAVHNLRSALDIMMCDIARIRGKNPKNVRFPFAETAADLEELFAGKGGLPFRRLGDDILTALRQLAPYKGGHIGLRGLHDLDVADKHKVVLTTYLVQRMRVNPWGAGVVPMEIIDFVETSLRDAIGFSFDQMYAPMAAGQIVMLEKSLDPEAMMQPLPGGPLPVIGPGLPFAGEPVLKTLESLAQLVDEIVEAFARHLGSGDDPTGTPPTVDDPPVEQ